MTKDTDLENKSLKGTGPEEEGADNQPEAPKEAGPAQPVGNPGFCTPPKDKERL